jgi:PASTA domain/Ricin-type beta-trefoil lectin domain-like
MFNRRRSVPLLLVGMLVANVVFAVVGNAAHAASLGWRTVHSRANGKCLDSAREDLGKPYSKIQIWTCTHPGFNETEGWEQQWWPEREPNTGSYFIRNRWTSQCLSGSGFTLLTVNSEACGTTTASFWDIRYENNDAGVWYQVLSGHYSGMCLTLTGNGSADGTVVGQDYCDSSFTNPAQQWTLGESLPFSGGVTVPNVLGYDQQDAVQTITNWGLIVDSVSNSNDCASPGAVEVQNPAGGSTISPGSAVHLTISTCSGGGGGGGSGGGGVPK